MPQIVGSFLAVNLAKLGVVAEVERLRHCLLLHALVVKVGRIGMAL